MSAQFQKATLGTCRNVKVHIFVLVKITVDFLKMQNLIVEVKVKVKWFYTTKKEGKFQCN